MARTEGRIFSSIWGDPDFRALSHDAQWLYFTLLSQPDLSPCGVLPDVPGRWSQLAKGTTARQCIRWRDELVRDRFVVVDPTTAELMVRSLIRRDGALESPNLTVAIARAYGAVHSESIRTQIVAEFVKGLAEGLPEGFPEGFRERLAERFDKPNRQPIIERFPKAFLEGLTRASPHHQFTPSPPKPLAVLPSSTTRSVTGVAS